MHNITVHNTDEELFGRFYTNHPQFFSIDDVYEYTDNLSKLRIDKIHEYQNTDDEKKKSEIGKEIQQIVNFQAYIHNDEDFMTWYDKYVLGINREAEYNIFDGLCKYFLSLK